MPFLLNFASVVMHFLYSSIDEYKTRHHIRKIPWMIQSFLYNTTKWKDMFTSLLSFAELHAYRIGKISLKALLHIPYIWSYMNLRRKLKMRSCLKFVMNFNGCKKKEPYCKSTELVHKIHTKIRNHSKLFVNSGWLLCWLAAMPYHYTYWFIF